MISLRKNIRMIQIIILFGILLVMIIPNNILMKNIESIELDLIDPDVNIDISTNLPRISESYGTDLVYSSYFGGNWSEQITAMDTDKAGNIYVVGDTSSSDFPVTEGANDTEYNGQLDTFIAKISANGSLIYCTFLGGSDYEWSQGICVCPDGSVIVVGSTISNDFLITPNALNKTIQPSSDIFISILNPTGSTFIYSSYFGGNSYDVPKDITLDSAGNIYIGGYTWSTNFPITPHAYDKVFHLGGGYEDAFVAKFSPNGEELIYSTFIGEISADRFYSIAVDALGCAYMTGETISNNFPCTLNATDSTYAGESDTFLVKLNSDGSDLLYSSFIGDIGNDVGYEIVIDSIGNIYLSGITDSVYFPVTYGAYDVIFNGIKDIFVMKIAPDCRTAIFSTFIGGSVTDWPNDLFIDNEGYVFLTGYTGSTDYPITLGSYNSTFGGGFVDIFVSKIDKEGDRLLYSSYIGGSENDKGFGIRLDNDGCIIIAGETESLDYPCTFNAYNKTIWGLTDIVISKLRIDPQISHPNDLLYEFGKTSNKIVWTIIDSMVGTTSYLISQSGSPITSGEWVSEIPIIFNVDGLDKGTYLYEITAYNGLGGFVKDTVIVTVEMNILTEIKVFLTQNVFVLILFGINLLGIIVIESIMQRKFKLLTKLISKPSTTQTNPLIKQSTDQKAPLPKQSTVQKIPIDEKKKKTPDKQSK